MLSMLFWVIVTILSLILIIVNLSIVGNLYQSYFYKVSRVDFIEDLRKIVNGSITYMEYDELTSCTIVQDRLLKKCQFELLPDEEKYSNGAKEGFYFNDDGNEKILNIIKMLETTKEAPEPDLKEIVFAWKSFLIVLVLDVFILAVFLWVKKAMAI